MPTTADREILWTADALRRCAPIRGSRLVPVEADARAIRSRIVRAFAQQSHMFAAGMQDPSADRIRTEAAVSAYAKKTFDCPLDLDVEADAYALAGPAFAAEEPSRADDFVRLWTTVEGGAFALRALERAESVVAERLCGYPPSMAIIAESTLDAAARAEKKQRWFARDRHVGPWRGLRFSAARADDDEFRSLSAEAERIQQSASLELRVALATAFERPEWCEEDVTAMRQPLVDAYAPLLVASPDLERARAILGRWSWSAPVLALIVVHVPFDLLARYGVDAVEILARSVVAYAPAPSIVEAVALVERHDVASFFTRHLTTKGVRERACEYLLAHPTLSHGPLTEAAAEQGPLGDAARVLLRALRDAVPETAATRAGTSEQPESEMGTSDGADAAWQRFETWLVAGAPSKGAGALRALGELGDAGCARRLADLVRTWPRENATHRALIGVDVLVKMAQREGGDVAVALLDELAQRAGSKKLQAHARERFDSVARSRGLTSDELADRAMLLGADDSEQALHLERVMCSERRWTVAEFRSLFVAAARLVQLTRRLVWGAYDGDGELAASFRVAEGPAFLDVDDRAVDVDDTHDIGVAHPLELSDQDIARWRRRFADHRLDQPFEQLARAIAPRTAAESSSLTLTRYAGLVVPIARVLALLRRGWRRGEPQDGAAVLWLDKPLHDGVSARLKFMPGFDVHQPHKYYGPQTLGVVEPSVGGHVDEGGRAVRLGAISAIDFSELVRDLETLTEPPPGTTHETLR